MKPSLPRFLSQLWAPYSPKLQRNILISGFMNPSSMRLIERSEQMEINYHRPPTGVDIQSCFEDRLIESEDASLYSFSQYTMQCLEEKRPTMNFFPWKDYKINLFQSTDFSVEAESVLRAYEGAINVICSVDGVQSQFNSFDKQMSRYQLSRLVFINNLNHKGSNPWQVLNQARSNLSTDAAAAAAAIQVPIGLEDDFKGLVDLVQLKAYYFHGLDQSDGEVPADMEVLVSEKRRELIETVSGVDDKLGEAYFRGDKPISVPDIQEAVRRATIAHKFIPVFMGDAFKYNKGLRLLLDGVTNYLPSPTEASYLPCPIEASNYDLDDPYKNLQKHTLVALAFKSKENWKYCQIRYLRIYEGVIRKGDFITNVNTGRTFEVSRLFRKGCDILGVIEEAHAGDIVALFDVNYAPTGDTFTDGLVRYTVTSGVQVTSQGKDSSTSRDGLERTGKGSPPFSRGIGTDGRLKSICLERTS